MIGAFDVHYPTNGGANVAAVLFTAYSDAAPAAEYGQRLSSAAGYESGSFYKRELPCILGLMKKIRETLTVIIVDGFVALGKRPGLGHHLFDALNGRLPVIGVAKSGFKGAAGIEVFRGESTRPLLVTAIGMDPEAAAEEIRTMHGKHRIPTLLKRVDFLSRQGLSAEQAETGVPSL